MSLKYILLATITSKVGSSLVSYPHEVLRSRLMYQKEELKKSKLKEHAENRESLFRLILRIVKTEGPIALYSGFSANLVRIIPSSAIIFMIYETLCDRLQINEKG